RHFFAIVDEVDSVLIDEARTPLIISGAVAHVDQRFEEMNPRVRRLVEAQMKLANALVAEAERYLKSNNKEDREKAGIALLRAYRGLPKHGRLTKLLNDPENKKLLQDTEITYLGEQGTKMQEIDEELYYSVEEKNHQIDITEKGRELLAGDQNDPDMFLIPDIAGEMSAIEGNADIDPEERQLLKDNAMRIYADRSDRIHTVNQLLRAYSLYDRDDEYVVQEGKVKIVDEFTGRILEGRRYSDGLHQAIEAKEGVAVERDTQTLATVTLQNYFRLYRKLAGMTGTAETEAGEFYQIYKLDVVVIPTNRPIVRKDLDDLVYRTKREKYNAVIEEIQNQVKQGRAVLVGTTSVEVSEVLSKMLRRVNVPHNVLNAKQHQREAEIVAEAGRKGGVTIATNMAGRGTDIKLVKEVKEAGGLCIIGTERHESRRIDRQLRGRAGRQGDPGSSQFFISLEDDLMRLFGGARIAAVMQKLNVPEGEPIQHSMVTKSVERAQKKVEENNFGVRKRLLEYDNVMNQQREVVYDRRRHALMGERVKGELFEYIEEMAGAWFDQFHPEGQLDLLKDEVRTHLLSEVEITDKEFGTMKRDDVIEKILEAAQKFYNRKEEMLGSEFMANLERVAVLQTIDEKWREHLRGMDELKEGIHLRAYGQKDPLLEYKAEAYRMFIELIREVNKDSVHFAFKYFPQMVERQAPVQQQQQAPRPAQQRENNGLPNMNTVTVTRSMSFSHPTATPPFASAHEPIRMPELPPETDVHRENREGAGMPKVPFRNTEPKFARNEPCWCGSGKKFKNCHG
ncbi:MAG TPA: SEC-C metal-binding domain-containing protein, partial [Patescibacteria group bacterium]|nr:SEC-C metal-binding domain-containing protein [Patescibacteria group bacterium]